MPSAIGLACQDAGVQAALRSWLDQGALEPPQPLLLEVSIGNLPAPPARIDDKRPAFHQPGVAIRAGPPQGGVHMSWEVAPAVAELAPGATTARVTLSPAAVARLDTCARTFLTLVLIFLLRRVGWHHIHAATALDPAGHGWLIAGNTQAGKSTTAALLASRGWQVGTDDVAFLAPAGERVAAVAFHAPIALRPEAYHLLGAAGGVFSAERRKVGYWPEELGGRWVPCIDPDIVLFTSVGDGRTSAAPLRARETLAELVRWSAWVMLEPDLAQEHLDLLTRLARQARSYRVVVGRDLFAHPTRLAELVR